MTVCHSSGVLCMCADSSNIVPIFSANPSHIHPPPLPARGSLDPSPHGSPHLSQGWHSPIPPAPNHSQPTSASYISNNYVSTPVFGDAPINSTWDSDSPDTTWGSTSKPKQSHKAISTMKPPLPVCAQACKDYLLLSYPVGVDDSYMAAEAQ